jgi:PAS domain S-box-containing protein
MEELIFEHNPCPMFVYDLDTLKILKANTAFSQKYEYSFKEIQKLELTAEQIRPECDTTAFLDSPANTNNGAESYVKPETHVHRAKDGTLFHVKITSQPYTWEGQNARLAVLIDVTEEIEAKEKLSEAYRELQHHIANSPLASVKWDRKQRIVEWSRQAENISGYCEKEVIGKKASELDLVKNSDVALNVQIIINSVMDGEGSIQFDTIIAHKSGRKVYIRVHSSTLQGPDGKLESVLTLIEDITEQKESEIQYRRLFENANDAIMILDGITFVDCNKKVEALFKAPKSEIIGKTPAHFSPEFQPDGKTTKEQLRERIGTALDEGTQVFEWQHQATDGELVDVEVSLNKVAFPDGNMIQSIVRNVTEKKKTEAKLRKSEELFRNLFQKSPAAIVMMDVKNQVQMVNDSFEAMFGYTLSDMQDKSVDQLILPFDEEPINPMEEYDSSLDNEFQAEGIRVARNGERKNVLIAGMPVYIDGEPVAVLGMYIDITDRKISEKKLKESLHEKQILVEEVHHRVKNNLAVVSGLLQMQTMHVDDERLTTYMQNSQMRIQSMAIVHEMLYKSETLSEIDFHDYVHKLSDTVINILESRAENISILIDVDHFVLNVNQAIPCALIISELITNAFEFAFHGRKKGRIRIRVLEEQDSISVEVKDDGIGLPHDFEEKRQKSLGINLIENLCMQLETDINIESGSWGTRFFFAFEKTDKPGSSSSNRL